MSLKKIVLLDEDEAQGLHHPGSCAQVGEWLKPTDCKSVPPSEVRRFESFPVHHGLSRLAGVTLSEVEGESLLAKSRACFSKEEPARDLGRDRKSVV